MSLIKEFSKTNKSSVDVLRFIIENRGELYNLLKHVTWDDFINGQVVLTEEIINKEIGPLILEGLGEYISSLNISIKDGAILIYVTGRYKVLPFKASYTVKIDSFEFFPGKHTAILRYNENLSSVMNFSGRLLLSIIRGILYSKSGKTFIEKGLDNQPGIKFSKNEISVNLDEIPGLIDLRKKEVADTLYSLACMELLSCKDGKLIFKIDIEFPNNGEKPQVTL